MTEQIVTDLTRLTHAEHLALLRIAKYLGPVRIDWEAVKAAKGDPR